MAFNYYQCANNQWMVNRCVENMELFPSPALLPATPTHPLQLYYSSQQQGLNHIMLKHKNSLAQMHRKSYSESSTTSNPISTISNEESPERLSSSSPAILDRFYNYSQTTTKAFHPVQRNRSSSLSRSPHSSPATPSDQPIDLSKPKTSATILPTNEASLPHSRLANLLSRKRKGSHVEGDSCHGQSNPLNLSKKLCSVSNTRIHMGLPKQNPNTVVDMCDAIDNPVELVQLYTHSQTTRKISECLNQMLCKLFTLQQYATLVEADKISLALDCWHRLLLWIYADQKFSFKVTYLPETNHTKHESTKDTKSNRINHPSMAFVKSIATFIKKYETLQVDSEELTLLFAITLFHNESPNSEDPEKIVSHRKFFTQQLHSYVMSKPGGGAKRYTDLLLYLPMLYGVNGKMVELLFFKHLSAHGDIKIILKETIKRLSHSTRHPYLQ